jgi:hypothetical protein
MVAPPMEKGQTAIKRHLTNHSTHQLSGHQHIHPVKEEGRSPYWIDEFVFEDDPKLTAAVIDRMQIRGGSVIVKLKKDANRAWKGNRDSAWLEHPCLLD